MPQLYRCPWTCGILAAGWSCEWTDGGGVGCGCTGCSPIIAFQAAPEDPEKALEELRPGLELQWRALSTRSASCKSASLRPNRGGAQRTQRSASERSDAGVVRFTLANPTFRRPYCVGGLNSPARPRFFGTRRNTMFPYQQLAATMMPQAGQVICGWYTCEPGSCLRTCAWTCAIQSGINHFPCYYSLYRRRRRGS